MKVKPSVSFVITCFNAESFIDETIQSCLNQSYAADEIIVVEDKSTDRSLDILENYVSMGYITLIRNDSNIGKCASLNSVLPVIKTKYIALIDADDTSESCRLEKQIEYMEEHPEVGCCSGFVNYINSKGIQFAKGAMIGLDQKIEDINNSKSDDPFSLYYSSVMIRSEIFKYPSLRFREQYFPSEDCDFWNRVVEAGWKVDIIPLYLANYRVHLKSAWGSKFMLARMKYRYSRESLRCRRRKLVEPSFAEFKKAQNKRPWLIRFNECRCDLAKGNYRSAGIAFGENRKMKAIIFLVIALLMQPSYAILRFLKQISS